MGEDYNSVPSPESSFEQTKLHHVMWRSRLPRDEAEVGLNFGSGLSG